MLYLWPVLEYPLHLLWEKKPYPIITYVNTTETMENFQFQPFKIAGNISHGTFLSNKIRKLSQGDLQSNFNSFSEMDSGACKEINADFAPV